MNREFIKFPSTPHLAVLSDVDIRGDKVFTDFQRESFLEHFITIEEKIDGANLGISFDSEGNILVQNRGNFIQKPWNGQWKKLENWLESKVDLLFEHLHDKYILFGEWCFAQHSIKYEYLPDWLLGFDVYDLSTGKFLSVDRRNELLQKLTIESVPIIARGKFTFDDLRSYFSKSVFSKQPAEGLYLRYDKKDWLSQRAKLVRSSFIQTAEPHWKNSFLTQNSLKDF